MLGLLEIAISMTFNLWSVDAANSSCFPANVCTSDEILVCSWRRREISACRLDSDCLIDSEVLFSERLIASVVLTSESPMALIRLACMPTIHSFMDSLMASFMALSLMAGKERKQRVPNERSSKADVRDVSVLRANPSMEGDALVEVIVAVIDDINDGSTYYQWLQ